MNNASNYFFQFTFLPLEFCKITAIRDMEAVKTVLKLPNFSSGSKIVTVPMEAEKVSIQMWLLQSIFKLFLMQE